MSRLSLFPMARADDIPPISPMGMTLDAFVELCAQQGVGTGRAKAAYQDVYRLPNVFQSLYFQDKLVPIGQKYQKIIRFV